MWARFALLGFKPRWVSFVVGFTTPSKLSMVLRLVRAVAFNTFGPLDTARESRVALFPAILALENSGIHVGTSYHGDVVPHIEAPVDKKLGVMATLYVPNVNPNDGHVGLWGDFDNSWFRCKGDVIKYMILFEDGFDIRRREFGLRILLIVVRYANDFQI